MDTSLSRLITETTLATLKELTQLHVCRFCNDAMSAVNSGAVLLAISTVNNDNDGDGFRYLIGLRKGTKTDPHLEQFFTRQ